MHRWQAFWTAAILALGSLTLQAAQPPNPAVVARQVDQLLQEELPELSSVAQGRCDDATFLRRVYLDLVGRAPTADEISWFLLDTSPDKRRQVVAELLNSPEYGQHWAGYWRDVVFYRASDPRARVGVESFERFMAEALNRNVSWDKIATEIITATGDVRQRGATGLILAQMGDAELIAAEVSRIFLGIQVQCAQCHDHPTDRWRRQQFHELAAFFPRTKIRPMRTAQGRTFVVFSLERPVRGRRRLRWRLEHYMPDLNNPQAEGTLMRPKFFLTGRSLPPGTPDLVRRRTLAQWITSPRNRWFAKAFVNRMWYELVGRGFYEPVDDLGPDRKPVAPRTLNRLCRGFIDSGYNIKWLMAVICTTEAYQRALGPQDSAQQVAFASGTATRLHADQVWQVLRDLLQPVAGISPRRNTPAGRARLVAAARRQFRQIFGFDPSTPADEVQGSIPQALFLMNNPFLQRVMSARPGTMLGQLLREFPDNEPAVRELYLRVLSREPKPSEMEKALAYIHQVGDRAEAFEDLLWALVNSTEFLHRR